VIRGNGNLVDTTEWLQPLSIRYLIHAIEEWLEE
jgi:hypothetical protein